MSGRDRRRTAPTNRAADPAALQPALERLQRVYMPQAHLLPIRRPRADRARQVADVLRQQIHAGGYDDGLPDEQDWAAEFFVSRNTIREALAVLKTDMLLGLKETFTRSRRRWAASEVAAADALSAALKDSDADVRAYARRALASPEHADGRSRASSSSSAELT